MINDKEQTIGKSIDKQGISFISSIDIEGFSNTKAMLPPKKRKGIKTFFFTTNTSSMQVAQFCKNLKASIYFCDKRFYGGVMLIGTIVMPKDGARTTL